MKAQVQATVYTFDGSTYLHIDERNDCAIVVGTDRGSFHYVTDSDKLSESFTYKHEAVTASEKYRVARESSKRRKSSPRLVAEFVAFSSGGLYNTVRAEKVSRQSGRCGVVGTVVAGEEDKIGSKSTHCGCTILRTDAIPDELMKRIAAFYGRRNEYLRQRQVLEEEQDGIVNQLTAVDRLHEICSTYNFGVTDQLALEEYLADEVAE